MNPDQSTDFFVDFYAKDDVDDEYNEGELSEVHCGRIKIVFKYVKPCVCSDKDWPTLPSMVSESDKVLYGSELSWEANPECYHYALQELKNWQCIRCKDLVFQDSFATASIL